MGGEGEWVRVIKRKGERESEDEGARENSEKERVREKEGIKERVR